MLAKNVNSGWILNALYNMESVQNSEALQAKLSEFIPNTQAKKLGQSAIDNDSVEKVFSEAKNQFRDNEKVLKQIAEAEKNPTADAVGKIIIQTAQEKINDLKPIKIDKAQYNDAINYDPNAQSSITVHSATGDFVQDMRNVGLNVTEQVLNVAQKLDMYGAQSYIQGINQNIRTKGELVDYTNKFMQAYEDGRINNNNDVEGSKWVGQLNSAYFNANNAGFAWRAGRMDAQAHLESLNEAAPYKTIKQGDFAGYTKLNDSNTYISGDIDVKSLNETQKLNLSFVNQVARLIGKNTNFVVTLGTDINGKYNADTNSITVDLNSGNNNQGLVAQTLAHELTHMIKEFAPANFDAIANYLNGIYGRKGVSLRGLVSQTMSDYAAQGHHISYETAYEEVVAKSMESMLQDGKVLDRLVEIENIQPGFLQRVKNFIHNILNKLKSLINNYGPDSAEGRFIANMQNELAALEEMYAQALNQARANAQNAKIVENDGRANAEKLSPKKKRVYNVDEMTDEDYNNRGWAMNLFLEEDRALLEERFNELPLKEEKNRVYHKEINNITAILSGTKDNPIIEAVIYYNADSVMTADKTREAINNGLERLQFKGASLYRFIVDINSYGSNGLFRSYARQDYENVLGGKGNRNQAIRPSDYENYGYYRDMSNRGGIYRQNESIRNQLDNYYLEYAINPKKNHSRLRSIINNAASKAFPYSKVVDEKGNLLRVYRHTDDVSEFSFNTRKSVSESSDVKSKSYYLNITKLASEIQYKKALELFNGEKDAVAKAREYLINQDFNGAYVGKGEYLAFYREQIKLADNVTYDDNGEIIPLSKRFDLKNDDTRYSLKSQISEYSEKELYDRYLELAENPEKNEDEISAILEETAIRKGYDKEGYHGTRRADRVGYVFDPKRATAGPMAYFTDNKAIADNYASDKADTSIAYDDEFNGYNQFKIKKNGNTVNVSELWKQLSASEKEQIRNNAEKITMDDDWENVVLNKDNKNGLGNLAYQIKEAKGNVLQALYESWITDGNIYGEEHKFLDVLKLLGIEANYNDPNAISPKTYHVYLKIQNAFDTSKITKEFIQEYAEYVKKNGLQQVSDNEWSWDKNNISTEKYVNRLYDDLKKGTTYSWTVVPDSMTEFLKSKKYDGIKDTGGKSGGTSHTVYIPFSSEQVKSADLVTYDKNGDIIPLSERFNDKEKDIRFSLKNKYTYDELVSKENMKLTLVDDTKSYVGIDKKDIIKAAQDNVKTEGKDNNIFVDDVKRNVLVSKNSIVHGFDRRLKESAPIVEKIGTILKNSIAVNELTPKLKTANSTYVLIGAAYSNDNFYVARFVVNEFTNELEKTDVLYAMSTKKGAVGKFSPESLELSNPHSTPNISIDRLLEIVNTACPDILSEDVLKHFGHNQRPEGMLGTSALYSLRNSGLSTRNILAAALNETALNEKESGIVSKYLETATALDQKRADVDKLKAERKALMFRPGKRDTVRISELTKEINRGEAYISRYDRTLLQLQAMKPMQDILIREKQKAFKKAQAEGRQALAEYREKSTLAMMEQKQHYIEKAHSDKIARDRTAMKNKVWRVYKSVSDLLLKGTNERNVKTPLRGATAKALQSFDMTMVDYEARLKSIEERMANAKDPTQFNHLQQMYDKALVNQQNMTNSLNALRTAYQDITSAESDSDLSGSFDDTVNGLIEEAVKETKGKNLAQMSLDEMTSVYKAFQAVAHQIRTANKNFAENLKATRKATAENALHDIETSGKEFGARTRIGMEVNKYFTSLMKPAYFFEYIKSPTMQILFDNLVKAEGDTAVFLQKARDFCKNLQDKYEVSKWKFDKFYTFEEGSQYADVQMDKSTRTFDLNLNQMMEIYILSLREEAKNHLLVGGFTYSKNFKKDGKLANLSQVFKLSEQTLDAIAKTLTPEQRSFAKEMQKFLATDCAEAGNKVSQAMYGIDNFTDKNYFPMKSSSDYTMQLTEADVKKGGAQMPRLKNMGFTKKLTPRASNPLVIDGFMNSWGKHVAQMANYSNWTLPLEDIERIYKYKLPNAYSNTTTFAIELEKAYGSNVRNYLGTLIDDLNGGFRGGSDTSPLDTLLSKFKKNAVFMSASVVVQQPSAILRAVAYIDPKYFVKSSFHKPRSHTESWAEVKKYAPVAIVKEMGGYDMVGGQSTVEWLTNDKGDTIKMTNSF